LLNYKKTHTFLKKGFTLIELLFVILIISFLIVSISKGMELYKSYRTEMANQLTIKSRVVNLPNLVLWFESSQKTSFEPKKIADGIKITKWKNIAPNLVGKLDFSRVSGSVGPTFKEDIQSSLSGAYFEGGLNNCLTTSANYDYGSNENSIFLVLRLHKYNDQAVRLLSSWNSGRKYWFELRQGSWGVASETLHFWINTPSSNNGDFVQNKTELINYQQKPGTAKVYFNKILQPDPDGYDPPNYTYQNAQLTIGCKLGRSSDLPSMFVHELIVFDRYLKDHERIIVEDYLYKKWNL